MGGCVILLLLGQTRWVSSNPQAPTRTPTPTYALTVIPIDPELLPAMPTAVQPRMVELAPEIPYEEKPAVVVQHADGSRTMYLIAPDRVDLFIEALPEGDELKQIIPPPSITGNEPPTPGP